VALDQQQIDAVHATPPALGVLLVNVGSPEAPTPAALRTYLAQFLWDRRVITPPPPRWLWWLILHGIILRTRPKKSAKLYANIWTPEGSPLIAISRRQRAALEARLRARLPGPLHVALGMGYGTPSVKSALEELKAHHCHRILVLPMFPQYCAPTTGSVFDGVAASLKHEPWVPELRFVHGWHDRPAYIAALAAGVRAAWAQHGRPEKLLLSFHGMPRRYLLNGDPYHCFCQKTGRLLAEALELQPEEWVLTFQSRFGREPWLQPYTDVTLRELAGAGVRKLQIISPAFSADCLETLEELAITNREIFEHAVRAAGGGACEYHYIPALNDGDAQMDFLTEIILEHVTGWTAQTPDVATVQRAQRIQRQP
jgi:ferrochelatase